ncbi:MAG: methyl-accepting chemotaxis protein [Oscillospiraceae bacterium]|nr:methyl-accepting chemotaxis protein [Oscillospiraceae bacterium]
MGKSGGAHQKSGLQREILLPVGALIIIIVTILSVLSLVNLNRALEKEIKHIEDGFDSNIKVAVETIISALDANHQMYLDGYVTEEVVMETAKKLVRDTRYSSAADKKDDGYFWADMADGLCVVHYNSANEGAMRWNAQDKEGTYFIQNFIKVGNQGGDYTEFYFGKPGDEEGSYKKRGYTLKYQPYGWYISTGNYYDDIDVVIEEIEQTRRIDTIVMVSVSVGVSIIGLIFMAFSIMRITRPVQILSDHIRMLSVGDTSGASVPATVRHDEIGSLQERLINLSQATNTQASIMEAIAHGDYSLAVDKRSDNDVMNQAIHYMLDKTNETLQQIHITASRVTAGSKQVADGAQALAQGSMAQNKAVEKLSGSVAEIASKTKDNTEMAERAANLASTIKINAEKGSRQMDEMMTAANEIREASHGINKVIQAIDSIAFQTNILALNAAVEAARAGQHGKGFAVVAEEVRSLASKSAEAAKDTGELIASSIEKADLGANIAEETAASLAEIVSGINESNQIVGEISKSSEDQSMRIMQVHAEIDHVVQVIQQNSATAQQSAAAAEEMNSESNNLEDLIAQFKLRR